MQHARGDWPRIGLNDAVKGIVEEKRLENISDGVRRDHYNSLLDGDGTPSRGRPDPKGNPGQGNRAKRRADVKAKRRKAGKERAVSPVR